MLSQLISKKNNLINEKVKLERKLDYISNEINKIQCGINKLCKHTWTEDYIDKTDGGCACVTDEQMKYLATRGGNRSTSENEF